MAWETAEGSYAYTRLPADDSVNERDCAVCAETKTPGQYPRYAVSTNCLHPPNTCLDCMRTHIKTQIASNVFHDNVVRCPECSESLALGDVQRYADGATYARFVTQCQPHHPGHNPKPLSTSSQRAHVSPQNTDTHRCNATKPSPPSPTSFHAQTPPAAQARSTTRAPPSPSCGASGAGSASASGTARPGTRP